MCVGSVIREPTTKGDDNIDPLRWQGENAVIDHDRNLLGNLQDLKLVVLSVPHRRGIRGAAYLGIADAIRRSCGFTS